MMNRKRIILPILTAAIAAAGVALHSCDEIDACSIDGRPMINCTLMTVDPTTHTERRDTLESLTVTALGTDSIILNRGSQIYTLSVPLNYVSDTTALVFHYDYENDPTVADTLYVYHTNTPYFVSLDCGYSVKQAVNSVDHTSLQIDSIKIRDVNTNTNDTENLKIYYRYTY